jgi:hypothetical protein
MDRHQRRGSRHGSSSLVLVGGRTASTTSWRAQEHGKRRVRAILPLTITHRSLDLWKGSHWPEGEEAKIVAVLHDAIEDTSVTEDDLRREGFGESVIAAVLCVTHRKDESYADYVVRCQGNEVARQVKLADLEDNSRPSRAILRPDRLEPDLDRLRKYILAYKFLTGLMTEEQYRKAMEGGG